MKFNFYLVVMFILFFCSAIFFIFSLIEKIKSEDRKRKSSLTQCFHCGENAVIWDSDFDFEDFGYDGKGIVHICHCTNCGAEIEYKIPIPDGDENK